jgi:MarR family transcriptional regulator, lower aerobic nicotinate degradation pathway regulator
MQLSGYATIIRLMTATKSRPPSLLVLPSYVAAQVSKYGRRRLEEVLREHGLLLGHLAILTALDDFGPMSQQQLADSLDFDKSHLVGRIDVLEERDLVTRTQDPGDRRRHRVALTPAGRTLLNRLLPVAKQSQTGFLEALTAAEQRTLISLLRRVLSANDAARQAPESRQ